MHSPWTGAIRASSQLATTDGGTPPYRHPEACKLTTVICDQYHRTLRLRSLLPASFEVESSSKEDKLIKIVKYRFTDVITRGSILFLVVISIAVLILAFVAAQGPKAVAGVYTTSCAIWHGPDRAGKTPIGQRLNLRDLRFPEVWRLLDSDQSRSITQVNGEMPAFGKNLGEDQTQLLVAHIHESARSSRSEKWPWQPVTRG